MPVRPAALYSGAIAEQDGVCNRGGYAAVCEDYYLRPSAKIYGPLSAITNWEVCKPAAASVAGVGNRLRGVSRYSNQPHPKRKPVFECGSRAVSEPGRTELIHGTELQPTGY